MIIDLLTATGLRVDDLLNTEARAWQGRAVTVKEAKTGKSKFVIVDDEIIRPAINRLSRLTAGRRGDGCVCLVPSLRCRDGRRLSVHRSTVWRHIQRAIRRAGLSERGYTVHSLRRVYAVNVLRATGSIEEARKALGHDRISTTLIYLQDALEAVVRGL